MECGLIGAVRLIRMSARRTAARGVSRIHQHHGYACPLCFVTDEGAQLKERPAMQLSALLPPSPDPRADAFEVFQSNPTLRAFGSLNDAFADRVVHIFCETALLTPKPLQSSSRRFGSQFLQFLSQSPMAIAHVIHHSAAVDGSIRIAGKVRYTQVNPEHVIDILHYGFFNLAGHQQIPLATLEQQITLTLARRKQDAVALAAHEWDGLSSLKRPDRERRVWQREGEDTIIVGDRGKRAKGTLDVLVELVGIADFGKCANGHLRRQAKRLTHILVAQFLESKHAEGAGTPGDIADGVAGGVGSLKRAPQRVGLLGRRLQLELCGQFHGKKYSTRVRVVQAVNVVIRAAEVKTVLTRCGALSAPLLGLKPRSFRRKISW